MISIQELASLVKEVQALSANNLKAGAEILKLHTNPNFNDHSFETLYKNLRENFDSQADQVEKYIGKLKEIREACLESSNAVKLVNEQVDQMLEIKATRDFAKSSTESRKQSSNGCAVT